jgi:hypothetical protein
MEEDSNLVTFTITKQTLVPTVSATGSVVSAILALVLIFLDELLFVPLLALAAIVLGHLALWVTLSAEKLVGALGLAGVILGYCSLTSFVTLVVLARRLIH